MQTQIGWSVTHGVSSDDQLLVSVKIIAHEEGSSLPFPPINMSLEAFGGLIKYFERKRNEISDMAASMAADGGTELVQSIEEMLSDDD